MRHCERGYSTATLPLKKGDIVWLLMADRSLSIWKNLKGREADPGDIRHHDLTDAVALPMGFPKGDELADVSATDMVIGKDGDGPLITMKDDGSILLGRNAVKEAARKDDPVEVTIPADTFLVGA